MIPEQKVKEALKVLTDHDGEYSQTRAAHDFGLKMEKIVLAEQMLESDAKSIAAREAEAKMSSAYRQAIEQTKEIAELDYKNRAKREAAAAIIEVWRTEQSNERAHVRAA